MAAQSSTPVDFQAECKALLADVKADVGGAPYTGFQWLQVIIKAVGQLEGLVAQYGGVEEQYAALEAEVAQLVPAIVAEWLPRARDVPLRVMVSHLFTHLVLDHLGDRRAALTTPTTTTPGKPTTTSTTPGKPAAEAKA